MRRQLLLAAVGAVALALSVVLVLVGRAVLATPDEVARATTSWPSETRVAKRERGLADRAAASLLATDRVSASARSCGSTGTRPRCRSWPDNRLVRSGSPT